MIRFPESFSDFWSTLSLVTVLGSSLVAISALLRKREKSLRGKKEMLLKESRNALERSPAIARALALLGKSGAGERLEHLLNPEVTRILEVEDSLKRDLDALCKVLNRIARAVTVTGILKREETEVFSGYFCLIQRHPMLSRYFYEAGFLDLWDFAQSFTEELAGEEI
jgi:hypothetical protein